jgi:integrase
VIRPNRNAKGDITSYGVRVYLGDGGWRWVGSFKTRREAREREAAALLERDVDAERALTCRELHDWFLARYEQTRKDSTVDTAKSSLKGWLEHFADRDVESIDNQEAERWAEDNGWRVPIVVTMFNQGVRRHERVKINPFAGLSIKGPGRRDLDPLTAEEVDALADATRSLRDAASATQFRAMVLFAAYSGLRMGEVFGLEWRDIDMDKMRIQVRRRVYRGRLALPKSNKPRLVALLPEARDALLALSTDRTGPVFTNSRETRWTQPAFAYRWQKVVGTFGRDVDPHELRHFCGHYLYVTRDLPARVVATQLGHASPRLVEELYGHFKVGALDEIDRAMGANVARLRDVSEGAG